MTRARWVQHCRDTAGRTGLRALAWVSMVLMVYQALHPPRQDTQRRARR